MPYREIKSTSSPDVKKKFIYYMYSLLIARDRHQVDEKLKEMDPYSSLDSFFASLPFQNCKKVRKAADALYNKSKNKYERFFSAERWTAPNAPPPLPPPRRRRSTKELALDRKISRKRVMAQSEFKVAKSFNETSAETKRARFQYCIGVLEHFAADNTGTKESMFSLIQEILTHEFSCEEYEQEKRKPGSSEQIRSRMLPLSTQDGMQFGTTLVTDLGIREEGIKIMRTKYPVLKIPTYDTILKSESIDINRVLHWKIYGKQLGRFLLAYGFSQKIIALFRMEFPELHVNVYSTILNTFQCHDITAMKTNLTDVVKELHELDGEYIELDGERVGIQIVECHDVSYSNKHVGHVKQNSNGHPFFPCDCSTSNKFDHGKCRLTNDTEFQERYQQGKERFESMDNPSEKEKAKFRKWCALNTFGITPFSPFPPEHIGVQRMRTDNLHSRENNSLLVLRILRNESSDHTNSQIYELLKTVLELARDNSVIEAYVEGRDIPTVMGFATFGLFELFMSTELLKVLLQGDGVSNTEEEIIDECPKPNKMMTFAEYATILLETNLPFCQQVFCLRFK